MALLPRRWWTVGLLAPVLVAGCTGGHLHDKADEGLTYSLGRPAAWEALGPPAEPAGALRTTSSYSPVNPGSQSGPGEAGRLANPDPRPGEGLKTAGAPFAEPLAPPDLLSTGTRAAPPSWEPQAQGGLPLAGAAGNEVPMPPPSALTVASADREIQAATAAAPPDVVAPPRLVPVPAPPAPEIIQVAAQAPAPPGETKLAPVAPAPAAAMTVSTAGVLPSGSFNHAQDYTWLCGEVQQSYKGIRLRFAPVDVADPYGGSVTLVPDAQVNTLKDGQLVRIRGQLVHPEHLGCAPPYKVAAIESLDR
jgi:hypothetical protein